MNLFYWIPRYAVNDRFLDYARNEKRVQKYLIYIFYFIFRKLLKLFVKPIVVGEKPYKKNSRTAPEFIISDAKNFEIEKERLINYILKTANLGENYFDNRESHSFGKLTKKEWNTMFYKHLDHHLNQFGV